MESETKAELNKREMRIQVHLHSITIEFFIQLL